MTVTIVVVVYAAGAIVAACLPFPGRLSLAEHAAVVFLWPVVFVGWLALGLFHLARRAWGYAG